MQSRITRRIWMKRHAWALILLPCTCFADPVEIWECRVGAGDLGNILVIAEVEEGRKRGKIKVAGIEHTAKFAVKGFDRRWDFVLDDDNTYDYDQLGN